MFIWCGRGCNRLYRTIEGLQWVNGVVRCAPHCAGDLKYLQCLISSSTYSSHSRQVFLHSIGVPTIASYPYNRQLLLQSIGVPTIVCCPILARCSYNYQLSLHSIGVPTMLVAPTIASCPYNYQLPYTSQVQSRICFTSYIMNICIHCILV